MSGINGQAGLPIDRFELVERLDELKFLHRSPPVDKETKARSSVRHASSAHLWRPR